MQLDRPFVAIACATVVVAHPTAAVAPASRMDPARALAWEEPIHNATAAVTYAFVTVKEMKG